MAELGRGMRALFGGVSFVVRSPGMWGWALVPAAIAVGVGLVLGALGVWGVVRASDALVGGGGAWKGVARVAFDVLAGAVALGAAVLVAVAVAQPLSRFALDRLTRRLDETRGPLPLAPSSSLLASVGVALTALGVTLPAVGALEAFTLVAPEAAPLTEPLAFVVSALALAWELLDHPLSRRGLGVGARLRWIKSHFFAVLGFAIAAQVLLFIPGLDLFLLPVGIVGATRLLAESEAGLAPTERGGPDPR